MKQIISIPIFFATLCLSSNMLYGDTADAVKIVYSRNAPSSGTQPGGLGVPVSSFMPPSMGSAAISSGSIALNVLNNGLVDFKNISSIDKKILFNTQSLAISKKTEIFPASKTTAAFVKCKNIKSLHADLLNLEIRRKLIYGEAKLLSLQEKFNTTNEDTLEEMQKDVYRK